jgi:cyclic pyranopterin phosphate synthase
MSGAKLSHLDDHGSPTMVDVSSKEVTSRSATAIGTIYINELAFSLLTKGTADAIDITDTANPIDPAQVQKYRKAEAKAGGNALVVAKLAGIMAAKSTSSLIPLCHPLRLTSVDLELRPTRKLHKNEGKLQPRVDTSTNDSMDSLRKDLKTWTVVCQATVRCDGKTGVEMEALTAVSVSLLTLWDMLKAVAGKEMEISDIRVIKKEGGKSGDFVRQ